MCSLLTRQSIVAHTEVMNPKQLEVTVLGVVLTLLFMRECNMAAHCKMTNAVCESSNTSWVVIEHCRLRAISRNLQKKANGYKPWLFDYTVDACAFMRKPRHPVYKMFWMIMRDFSTVNHSCPYVGKQLVKDFFYDPRNLTLPVHSGEYLLLLTWLFDNKKQFVTNIYFTFQQDDFYN